VVHVSTGQSSHLDKEISQEAVVCVNFSCGQFLKLYFVELPTVEDGELLYERTLNFLQSMVKDQIKTLSDSKAAKLLAELTQ